VSTQPHGRAKAAAVFADKCSEKAAKGRTNAAEILALSWLRGGEITAGNSQQEQPGLAVNRRIIAV
jgi:hypothetical protein